MGRKDAAGGNQLPVAQYRKTIGNSEDRRAKNSQKIEKRKRETAKNFAPKQAGYGLLILASIFLIVMIVYLAFYLYLRYEIDQIKSIVDWFNAKIRPRIPFF